MHVATIIDSLEVEAAQINHMLWVQISLFVEDVHRVVSKHVVSRDPSLRHLANLDKVESKAFFDGYARIHGLCCLVLSLAWKFVVFILGRVEICVTKWQKLFVRANLLRVRHLRYNESGLSICHVLLLDVGRGLRDFLSSNNLR